MHDPSPIAEPDDPLADAHRVALKRLREMGLDLAERLHAQSSGPDADVGEIAVRFARVARAVRQTIALESHLAELKRRREAAQNPDGLDLTDPANHPRWLSMKLDCARRDTRKTERKLEGLSLIQRAIAKQPLEREVFDERLFEHLGHDYFDATFAYGEAVSQIIETICAKIGLSPDWPAFTDVDWTLATPETRAALTGLTPHPPEDPNHRWAPLGGAQSQAP